MKKGWKGESQRHSVARKGIKTKSNNQIKKWWVYVEPGNKKQLYDEIKKAVNSGWSQLVIKGHIATAIADYKGIPVPRGVLNVFMDIEKAVDQQWKKDQHDIMGYFNITEQNSKFFDKKGNVIVQKSGLSANGRTITPKYWIFYKDEEGNLTQVPGGSTIEETELYFKSIKKENPDAYIMSNTEITKQIKKEQQSYMKKLDANDMVIKGWKNTSRKHSDGSKSIEWTSKDKKLTIIDNTNWGSGWVVAVSSTTKDRPPQLLSDTNNTKEQAYKKASEYMKNNRK